MFPTSENNVLKMKKVNFCNIIRDNLTKMGVTARNRLLALLMHILGEKIWKKGPLSELNNLQSPLLFFGKLKSGASFVILGPKLTLLSAKCYFPKMGLSPRKSPYLGNRIVFGGGSKGKVVAPSVLVICPVDKYCVSKTEN